MNPPAALNSAMSRDRKPFTYTPGGLDLSEIKSSRMAARLMRNAMNEGVPEQPKQNPTSVSSTSVAVPNFNCLPVQVFPAFNLPANPKSLLRTRSNPSQAREFRDPPIQRLPPPQQQLSQFVNNARTTDATQYDTFNINTTPYSQINNSRPVSMFEYASPANTYTPVSYGSDNYNEPALPEISYEAEYLQATPKSNTYGNTVTSLEPIRSTNGVDKIIKPNIDFLQDNKTSFNEPNLFKDFIPLSEKKENTRPLIDTNNYLEYVNDNSETDTGSKITSIPLINNSSYQNFSENLLELKSKKNNLPFTDEYVDVTSKLENKENVSSFVKPTTDTCELLMQDMNENSEKHIPNYDLNKVETDNREFATPLQELIGENSFISDNIYKTGIEEQSDNTEQQYNETSANTDDKQTILDINTNMAVNYSTFPAKTQVSKPVQDLSGLINEKKEVIVKKQTIKKENNIEEQNGSSDQNGDSDVQAVIKLPDKKSAAKTETKVEVTKKTLSDGSIEEVKKTITKTTIDGRTEIKTKTETTIIPNDDGEEEVEEVDEDEDDGGQVVEEVIEEPKVIIVKKSTDETTKPVQNGNDSVIKTEERSESTITTSKKVVVVQNEAEGEEEEEEELIENDEAGEAEPVTFVIKQTVEKAETPKTETVLEQSQEDEEETEETQQNEEIIKKENVQNKEYVDVQQPKPKEQEVEAEEEEVEEEEEYEEAEEEEAAQKLEKVSEASAEKTHEPEKKAEVEEKEVVEELTEDKESSEQKSGEEINIKQEQTQEVTEEKQEVILEKQECKEEKKVVPEETLTIKVEVEKPEYKVPLREPSVPLEKVEDVEIKPIGLGDFLTKTHTENTEIITNVVDKPTGLLTEINRIENIVTVNRTTKTLDHAYENITQQGVPTLKTYFTPHIDKILSSPQPARPYQPVHPPEPQPERRHSLLLERLSVERQMPSDIYQNNYQYSNQTIDQQKQFSQEPQAEVLTVSNVKPSQITNQQWYQQKENAIYNNVTSTSPVPASVPGWTQPKPQSQSAYQPQPQYQPSPTQQSAYQPQTQYQPSPTPQPQYQAPPQPQYQVPLQPQPQYQPSYTTNLQENSSSTYQNTYSTYTPKPTNWAPNAKPVSPIPTIITPNQPSQYSYLNRDSSESYQNSTQQFSSASYVPPPWEQDSNYVPPEPTQNYYQAPPQSNSFSPASNQGWKPTQPASKFSKPPPTAYIPPKPNQSFVASATSEPPKMPGRKTYYSEYERRYISVPESTYIPGDSKYQPQPDPSPAYYYDNNEPVEEVEPQWRRELREFTEKSQSQTTTTTNVKPPWESEVKYAKAPEPSYTPTPTWSQTVRPQSWRERSFESEFVSQEWPKTNTLGRGRPLSSYGKESIPERTRGVSVDRYNPNSYQVPVAAEHPPVQTHTHVPPAPHATGYHNPNVPAYHSRASAEPREQISYQQPRNLREARASPFQSRSFKYLQWITGTED